MNIRKATRNDSPFVAEYLLLAMADIVFKFIGENDLVKAKRFMNYFTEREDNQYSYQNCWVVENENGVVAAACIYDGGKLAELRKPVLEFIQNNYIKNLEVEEETRQGEFYIDSLGVKSSEQGKGIGTALVQYLISEYVVKKNLTLGLLVEPDNFKARKVYLKLGFKPVGMKTLVGKHMEHLQLGF